MYTAIFRLGGARNPGGSHNHTYQTALLLFLQDEPKEEVSIEDQAKNKASDYAEDKAWDTTFGLLGLDFMPDVVKDKVKDGVKVCAFADDLL